MSYNASAEKTPRDADLDERRLKLYLHKEHYYPKLMHGSEEDTYELHHLSKHAALMFYGES